MKFIQSVIMGLVQGLTEFLPVSSSGHLALIKALFNVETDTGILFDVLLHFGTLISIIVVFYKDILRLILEFIGMCRDLFGNMVLFFKSIGSIDKAHDYAPVLSNAYRRFVVLLIVSTIPTGLIGIFMDDVVSYANSSLLITGICLIITGLILVLSDFLPDKGKRLKDVNFGDAFCVGVSQGIATLPGLSRSGTTITACMLCGFDRRLAAKYSFIMSIPAVLGAVILEISDVASDTITAGDVGCYIVGMIIAGAVGYVALKITMKLVISKYFKYLAFYCMFIGAVSIITYIVTLK